MECGKLTAKLRDAVPVCFIENGKEVKRFKNIEIPDEIKKLPYQSFEFSVPVTGAITFKIMFEEGVLPKVWPEARTRKSRKVSQEEAPLPEKITAGFQAALEQAEAEGQPVAEIAEVILPSMSTFLAVVKLFAFDLFSRRGECPDGALLVVQLLACLLTELFARDEFRHEVHILSSMAVRQEKAWQTFLPARRVVVATGLEPVTPSM